MIKNKRYQGNYIDECLQLLNEKFLELSKLSKVEKCIFFGKSSFNMCKGILQTTPHFAAFAAKSTSIIHPSDTRKGHWDVTYGIAPKNYNAKTKFILSLVPLNSMFRFPAGLQLIIEKNTTLINYWGFYR